MNNKKEFLRIVVAGTAEKPYYTIDYIENGKEFNGYGSYNLEFVLKWKEEMERDNAQIEEKNKSEGEKKMKTGDKFIIELGEKIAQYQETPDGKRNLIDTVYRIEGTNAAITEKDLQNMEEYKEDKDEEEIKAGDEIESSKQVEKAVVLWVEADGYWNCLQEKLFFTVNEKQKKYWKKTGKHYDEVEKIFQKLKGEGEIPFL